VDPASGVRGYRLAGIMAATRHGFALVEQVHADPRADPRPVPVGLRDRVLKRLAVHKAGAVLEDDLTLLMLRRDRSWRFRSLDREPSFVHPRAAWPARWFGRPWWIRG
jgi:hypothetical protein